MIDGKVIRGVDLKAPSFIRSFRRIKDRNLQEQIKDSLQEMLLLDLDQAPRKFHLHPLTSKLVASAIKPGSKVHPFTIHVTPDDRYKASFTFEDGTAYFRLVDLHDIIDRSP